MDTSLEPSATPRLPSQARSRKRFAQILQAAEEMLAEEGLSGFSIPALAQKLGISRRSIYFFFPTPYALLNEVTRRHIQELEEHLGRCLLGLGERDVIEIGAALVSAAAQFHNARPVARLLILGGAVTDHSYRIQEANILHLGHLAGRIMRGFGLRFPEDAPDLPTIAVELGVSCFRYSFYRHGQVQPRYVVEAVYVMAMYLREPLGLEQSLSRAAIRQLLGLPSA